jgi:hypothetical protein
MCSPVNPICDVSTVLGNVGGTVAGSVFNEVAKAFASSAKDVTDWMWTVIAKTTTVQLSGGWFTSTLGITLTLAGLVITALYAAHTTPGTTTTITDRRMNSTTVPVYPAEGSC